MNYSNTFITQKSLPNRVVYLLTILGTSWIIALSAQITFFLPFSPVPITGQTLVVLLAGLILGKKMGTASVFLYLLQGAAGLPVFAGGKSGVMTLFGPTGGYLIGFLAAVYIVGMLSELRFTRSVLQAASALIIGNLIIYTCGLVWLARFVGETQVLQLGLYPFLAGDLVKVIFGVILTGSSSALMSRIDPIGNREFYSDPF